LWKDVYTAKHSQGAFTVKAGEKILNSTEFFNAYVNAFAYHKTDAKPTHKTYLETVTRGFSLEAQKPLFVLLLGFRLVAINQLGSFLLTCFDREGDGREITVIADEAGALRA
jgi:hypothetical protein